MFDFSSQNDEDILQPKRCVCVCISTYMFMVVKVSCTFWRKDSRCICPSYEKSCLLGSEFLLHDETTYSVSFKHQPL